MRSLREDAGGDMGLFPWGDRRRFHSYARYMRGLFGGRVQKLTIDAGLSCPHRPGRNGAGGCIYCNNAAFNPSYCAPSKGVTQQVEEGIAFHAARYRRAEGYMAYFQAYTNTYAPAEELRALFEQALVCPQVKGLVVGTRPDCLPGEVIRLLAELSQRCVLMVELGAESMHDGTLRRIHRGHNSEATRMATRQLHEAGIRVGLHMILGLPGEDEPMMIDSVREACELPISSIKLHQLQVLRGTALENEWRNDPEGIPLFTLEGYLQFLCRLVPQMPWQVAIERVGAECPPRYLVAPQWGLVRNDQLLARFEEALEMNDTWQGKLRGAVPLPAQG